ncbi:DUF294 nucleotidyltransferase-like domain-containing protein [Dethiobacter alkaliphilus]|uniref:DUF294 nucleotidyltransferase-like domain-containing protein n=1 Tax=Dethiobacter alkaliphilus TaxID=427926 RepID=UPI00222697AF|nr:DUF294 nucleotidyltransferase-like domain-containing protein [Dethiobacter alkaliphilus]MCW3490501.1 DUF294 nucleotidyltransferase-like domain-containing protein [Dethiobacter alkaliphilus]
MKKFLLFKGQQTDVAEILKQVNPFSCLDTDTLNTLVENVEVKQFHSGEYVYRQGDDSLQSLFVVVSGLAEISILDEQSRETVVATRKPRDFFGETAFLSDDPYIASVRAVEDLTLLKLPFDIFENILSRHPEFSSQFSKILTARMRLIYHIQMSGASSGYVIDQPMHKRVADLMSAPVITCLPGNEITDLARTMTSRNVSSIIVTDQDEKPIGIITEKDLVKKVVAAGCFVKALKAEDIMSENLLTVKSDAFYYEALLTMVEHSIKHLVVTAKDKAIGMITIRDMIESRGTAALKVAKNIELQGTIEDLARTGEKTDAVLEGLVVENASSKEILQLITQLFDRLTRKVIRICEQEMIDEGYGPPPVAYSWISMGSSGRQEQFVKTDQDNGIIYENVPAEKQEEVAAYFLRLGEKVVDGLHRCGFALCPGNVMASNPMWCRSLRDWMKVITKWVNVMDPENVRLMTIFLDFRHISGEKKVCDKLWKYVINKFQESPSILHFLAQDDLSHRVPLNFFKQIIAEKTGEKQGLVNLKASASVHLVDCLRIFALREKITATNTLERLDALAKRNVFSPDNAESLTSAYETLMSFRIWQSLLQLNTGQEPDNYIDPNQLTKREKAALREAFIVIDRLQNLTSHAFKAYN